MAELPQKYLKNLKTYFTFKKWLKICVNVAEDLNNKLR